jgi:hypothetical protein
MNILATDITKPALYDPHLRYDRTLEILSEVEIRAVPTVINPVRDTNIWSTPRLFEGRFR